MPRLTRWFLKSAIACLLASLALGVVAAAAPASATGAALAPLAVHLLVFGWATQTIFGVAFWMFPRPDRRLGFGAPWLGWVAFAGINLGLALRAAGEPAQALAGAGAASVALLVASATTQLLAVVAFVALIWRRVAAPRG